MYFSDYDKYEFVVSLKIKDIIRMSNIYKYFPGHK